MSLVILLHAARETARISLPTVMQARRGTLTQKVCDERLRSWSGRLMKRVDADVQVLGLSNLDELPGPYVVVSNHQSHYDIPALFVALPFTMRMVGKKELFETPLWGAALRASGFIEIDRKSPKAAYRAIKAAGEAMRDKTLSLFIAPEGTRSADGSLGEFKRGAFDIARIARVPILPVAISGTRNIHQKGKRAIGRGVQVSVQVLPPIAPENFEKKDALALRVRGIIAKALDVRTKSQGKEEA